MLRFLDTLYCFYSTCWLIFKFSTFVVTKKAHKVNIIIRDRVSGQSIAIGRVRPSVRSFVFVLAFEPTDL